MTGGGGSLPGARRFRKSGARLGGVHQKKRLYLGGGEGGTARLVI